MTSFPAILLKLVEAWGVNVADFTAAYEDQVAGKGYLPGEWVEKVAAILAELNSTVTDPVAIWAAIEAALMGGYNPRHGLLA